jgi:hypothetical protein
LDEADAWAYELARAAGREFALPEGQDCRLPMGDPRCCGAPVHVPAGTHVRLLSSSHDPSLTRVYHTLEVMSGPLGGSKLCMLQGPGEFPWESAAQTRQRLSQQSITRRLIEADRRKPRA